MTRTAPRRALPIALLVAVAVVCWTADLIALFAIGGATSFGGDPMSARQRLASQLVTVQGLVVGSVVAISILAIAVRRMRSWWAVGAAATAMLSATALTLALSGPIAASGECLDWASDDQACGVASRVQGDHVAVGLAAIALALTSIALALVARRSVTPASSA